MTTPYTAFDHLSDQDLLREVTRLAACERDVTARLIASLAELDARRLYLAEGYGSLFAYCVQALHLSEHAAYGRIEAARAARRFPVILERLAEGAVTLTTITLLARHLTNENHLALLAEAQHRSKRDVQLIIARLQPQPDVPSTVRKLPTTTPPAPDANASAEARTAGARADESGHKVVAPSEGSAREQHRHAPVPRSPLSTPAAIAPLAPTRYKVSFTISAETYAKLQQAQDLLRHVIPNGDPAALFDRALTLLLAESSRTKLAATAKPRATSRLTNTNKPGAGSRHIPAAVKRSVWQRDGGQCAFVSANGRRCTERGFLEFHHLVPYAKGGEALVDNIELRCRRHNAHEAERDFGLWQATRVREVAPVFAACQDRTRSRPSPVRGLRPLSAATNNVQPSDAYSIARAAPPATVATGALAGRRSSDGSLEVLIDSDHSNLSSGDRSTCRRART